MPRTRKSRRGPVNSAWPTLAGNAIDGGDVTEEACVGLALIRAIGVQAAGHAAGMHVTGKDECCVGSGPLWRSLAQRGIGEHGCCAKAEQLHHDGASGWRIMSVAALVHSLSFRLTS